MKSYSFKCTEEEYDPKRVIRECVKDGRLWFVMETGHEIGAEYVLYVRKDFLRDFHGNEVWGEDFNPTWGFEDGDDTRMMVPGYRWWNVTKHRLEKCLEQLRACKPKLRTYTVYYHGGK